MTEDEKWMELFKLLGELSNLDDSRIMKDKMYEEYRGKKGGLCEGRRMISFLTLKGERKVNKELARINNLLPSLGKVFKDMVLKQYEVPIIKEGLDQLYEDAIRDGEKLVGIFFIETGGGTDWWCINNRIGVYLEKRRQ